MSLMKKLEGLDTWKVALLITALTAALGVKIYESIKQYKIESRKQEIYNNQQHNPVQTQNKGDTLHNRQQEKTNPKPKPKKPNESPQDIQQLVEEAEKLKQELKTLEEIAEEQNMDMQLKTLDKEIIKELNPYFLRDIKKNIKALRNHRYILSYEKKIKSQAKQYEPIIRQAAYETNVPASLLEEVIMRESGFNPEKVSRAGAAGLMQLMPKTAKLLGLRVNPRYPKLDERFDPEKAIIAGATYLAYLHERFGSWELALSAYNLGETKVWRIYKRELKRTNDKEKAEYNTLLRIGRISKKTGAYTVAILSRVNTRLKTLKPRPYKSPYRRTSS